MSHRWNVQFMKEEKKAVVELCKKVWKHRFKKMWNPEV